MLKPTEVSTELLLAKQRSLRTFVQTPFFCGQCSSAGDAVFLRTGLRAPLLTWFSVAEAAGDDEKKRDGVARIASDKGVGAHVWRASGLETAEVPICSELSALVKELIPRENCIVVGERDGGEARLQVYLKRMRSCRRRLHAKYAARPAAALQTSVVVDERTTLSCHRLRLSASSYARSALNVTIL